MNSKLMISILLVSTAIARPQLAQYDYGDYFYDDLLATLEQEQAPAVARGRQLDQSPSTSTHRPENITHIAVLKDSRYTDPATGAYVYDYFGADGSGKFEIRYLNGSVVGNFTFLNAEGVRETRWYSAGVRGTEVAGDGVVSPAPPTLIDETTGANYVDLGNYELYKHLEVPYVHIAGPSDADERGQLTNPSRRPQPSPLALDHGDDRRFDSIQQQQFEQQQQQDSVFRQQSANGQQF